ncbi:MAG: hydroxymethylpyrimidine/phosphomethylpyrimidine kinase [Parvibaculaceae bacterium]|jgi:hydroxymethylpyrimidine/phosphomethylpyrimidine kinase|nr:bifunctional hydroxymethylpyrimidine kinase/phosphomethylpyrimidine kinase [Parvibaculaceae bacterium]
MMSDNDANGSDGDLEFLNQFAEAPAPQGRVLIVAGSDSSGGAGIQADIKSVTMMGAYAATAVSAITVQNTLGVQDVHGLAPELITAQMLAVLDDIGADVIKTGMLHSTEVVEAVIAGLSRADEHCQLVVDPVMVATSGDRLLDREAVTVLRDKLLPLADLITPNMPEAAVLAGFPVETLDDQKRAGEALLALGCGAVLVKGGHGSDALVHDVLVTEEQVEVMSAERLETVHTHGTGCSLASAIAGVLSQGAPLHVAVNVGRDYVREAIRLAPGFGKGHGPINHMHPLYLEPEAGDDA